MKALKLNVGGRVQAVGYRRYLREMAQQGNLTGYVRNEKDGSVTIFVQGEESAVRNFVEAARNPPPPARTKELKQHAARPEQRLKFFEIRFGSVPEELQEGFGAMQTEFRDYRGEFSSYRSDFTGFAERTDQNFRTLDHKYGEISQKLTSVLETLEKESVETRKELTRAVDNLAKLVEKRVGGSDPI